MKNLQRLIWMLALAVAPATLYGCPKEAAQEQEATDTAAAEPEAAPEQPAAEAEKPAEPEEAMAAEGEAAPAEGAETAEK